MRSTIGQTSKKSTAYTWAKNARDAGKQDVKVVKSDDGYYTVTYELPEAAASDEWTIPTPDFGPEMEVDRRIRQNVSYVADLRAQVAKWEKDLKWRETRAPHLVPKYQGFITDTMELIELTERTIAPLQAEAKELKQARSDATRAFWSRVEQKVLPQVAGRSENSDLYIRATGKGGYRVDLATGKVIEGPHGDYPETVFGYEATVNGPDQAFGLDLTHGWKPATVRWGSYSGMETVADARRMMHVYEAAAELAVITNDLLGLGEEGTDR